MEINIFMVIHFKCHLHKIIFVIYTHSKFNMLLFNDNNVLKFSIQVDNTTGYNDIQVHIYIYLI